MNPLLRSLLLAALFASPAFAANDSVLPPPRERLLMDAGWRFAFGHPYDKARDFYGRAAAQGYTLAAENLARLGK